MRFSTPRISGPGLAAAAGAGLASAVCMLLPAQKLALGVKAGAAHGVPFGTFAAVAMGMLAPLPLMIASLGFGSFAGIVAVVVGGLAIAAIALVPEAQAFLHIEKLSMLDALSFLVMCGAPSWLMTRLVAAPVGGGADGDKAARLVRREERLLGTVLLVAIGFGAISGWMILSSMITGAGGLDALVDQLVAQYKTAAAARPDMPKGVDAHKVAVSALYVITAVMAVGPELLLLFNLWCAARIAQTSGLLSVPWPDIPRHLRLPRPLALVFAVSLGLSFAGGLAGLLSLVVSGAIAAGLLLQGLAVLHAVTRGKTYRTPALVIVYLLMPWPAPFYGLLGLLDMAFAFRDRQKPLPPPPPPPGPWRQPPAQDRKHDR